MWLYSKVPIPHPTELVHGANETIIFSCDSMIIGVVDVALILVIAVVMFIVTVTVIWKNACMQ